MTRPTTALAAGLGATALPAQAAVSSASIDGLTATLNPDGANDNVTVSVSGGLLVHGQTTGGLASGSDWDSATDGDQTVPADGMRTFDRTPNEKPRVTKTLPVTIGGGLVTARKGTASIKLSCPAGSSANCAGSLAVRTAKAVRLAGLKAVLQLGNRRYNIAPGATKTLKLKLANGSRRLADRKGRLKVRALASTGPSGNPATSSKRLTLALGNPAKRGR